VKTRAGPHAHRRPPSHRLPTRPSTLARTRPCARRYAVALPGPHSPPPPCARHGSPGPPAAYRPCVVRLGATLRARSTPASGPPAGSPRPSTPRPPPAAAPAAGRSRLVTLDRTGPALTGPVTADDAPWLVGACLSQPVTAPRVRRCRPPQRERVVSGELESKPGIPAPMIRPAAGRRRW
jgi:hypothetical protein